MFEAVEKLRNERQRLSNEKRQFSDEIDTEIRKIDTAIQKFTQGLEALSGGNRQRSAASEIEAILTEAGKPLHVREITNELHRRGYTIAFQSVSATLQIKAKKHKTFRRVAPATFALRESRSGNGRYEQRGSAK